MTIRFWGVRGQVATPGNDYIRFGGNTPCIEIRNSSNELLIVDAGTGLVGLGSTLMQSGFVKPGVKLNILLSDVKWDHTQGFPFFVPCYIPGVNVSWFGPTPSGINLETLISGNMQYSYFPIRLDELKSNQHFVEVNGQSFTCDTFQVDSMVLNRDFPGLAFKITCQNRSVGFVPGYETKNKTFPDFSKKLAKFLKGCHVLVHDAYFLDEEETRIGWGRASIEAGARLAEEAGVDRLVLTGYSPGRIDGDVDAATNRLMSELNLKQSELDVIAAREGMTCRV